MHSVQGVGKTIIRGPSDDPEIHDQDPLFESIKTQEKNLDPEEMWVPCGRGIRKQCWYMRA